MERQKQVDCAMEQRQTKVMMIIVKILTKKMHLSLQQLYEMDDVQL